MIYIASPYSHQSTTVREERYQDAFDLAGVMLRQGYNAFSPIAYSHPLAEKFELPKGWEWWLKLDYEFLRKCDTLLVYQLFEWEESRGVTDEINFAAERNIKILSISEDNARRVIDDNIEISTLWKEFVR